MKEKCFAVAWIFFQQPTWRLWGEEKADGALYTVYLKKVRYHRPTRSLSSSHSVSESKILRENTYMLQHNIYTVFIFVIIIIIVFALICQEMNFCDQTRLQTNSHSNFNTSDRLKFSVLGNELRKVQNLQVKMCLLHKLPCSENGMR